MQLSATSKTIIDLVLLTDAVHAEDLEESRRLARRLTRIARVSGWPLIARQARAVELLAILDAPFQHVAAAVERLLLMSERHIQGLPVPSCEIGTSPSDAVTSPGASFASYKLTTVRALLRKGAV